MAVNTKKQKLAYGARGGTVLMSPLPVTARRAPTTNDISEVGTTWIDQVGNDIYILLKVSGGSATWLAIGSGAGAFDSLTSATTITAGTGLTVTSGTVTITDIAGDPGSPGVVTNTAAGVLGRQSLNDGELLIGHDDNLPAASTLTGGAGIHIGNASGAITITATGATAVQYTTDTGVVIPDGAGNVNVLGGTNIGTAGAGGDTITINVDNAPTFTGLITADAGFAQTAGNTQIKTTTDAGRDVYFHLDGGTNETYEVYVDQSTRVQSIYLHSDLGGTDIRSGLSAANAIRLYASAAAGGIDIDAGTAGISAIAANGPINIESGTGDVNVGADTTAHSVTVGSTSGAADTTLQAGAGAMTFTAGGIFDVNATGNITIDSSGGTIGIGVDADTNNISIGTGVAERVISIGSPTDATAVNINTGSGGFTVSSGALVNFTPNTQTAASPATAVTSNTNIFKATFTGFTTESGLTQQFTINNSLVSASSGIICTVANKGAADAKMEKQRITPGAGSFTINTINNGTDALNGDVIISCIVLD